MSKKQLVQIASRAIALYLVFWSLGNLANLPAVLFSLLHAKAGVSAGQDYLHKYYVVLLWSHIGTSVALFLAAVWVYRCGPQIEAFLSPSENS